MYPIHPNSNNNSDKMKVGIIQQACTERLAENISNLVNKIRKASSMGAELVVLQELHNSLYFCQTESTDNFDLAETIPGPSTEQFGELAKELGIVIVLSLFEKRAAGLYHNTAVVIERDVARQGLREGRLITAGRLGELVHQRLDLIRL